MRDGDEVTALDRFSPATREWFSGAFPAPTAAQAGAWEAISSGAHALVIAPTGSGKTLSAFLWSLDRLATTPPPDEARRRTRVLYLSPLKALGVDVERNLRSPLVGIAQTARRLGLPAPGITVGVRSGDTPAGERRMLQREPPDILITTPESLFLMLTSAAREMLAGVETVIVDEVHAVAGTKRGAHLALSLERLDELLAHPVQRIGLSATVRPAEEVARFLGGSAPVTVVAPPSEKRFELRVVVPVDDMTALATAGAEDGSSDRADERGTEARGSIWPHVEESIVDAVLEHRSTIVFANSRRLAERLTARLNELWEERRTGVAPERYPAQIVGGSGLTVSEVRPRPDDVRDLRPRSARRPASLAQEPERHDDETEPLLARAHHGSVSKEQRAIIEDELKSGRLRCVVATSSLELGIDMGAVDLVIQVESPPSVSSGLQRLGRAGHQVGEVSRGAVYPKHRTDLVHAAVTSERMLAGSIEATSVPQNPLDVLAQQTVAACALGEIEVEAWFDAVRRSAPFRALPRSAFDATLDLLAGRYPSDEFAELRPRIVWDRVGGTIEGRPGAQRLAVTSGGTIPDRGLFGVFIAGTDDDAQGGRAQGRRVGELDEEMVYESRVSDVIALGATSWRIQEITHDRVIVTPAFGQPGRVPFWRGDAAGRPVELGRALGAFTRELRPATAGAEDASARLGAAGLDERAIRNLVALLEEQQQATGQLPTDRTLVVERFRDELGDWRVVMHSPYGMRVHAPWALAVTARIRERHGIDGAAIAADDGIVVRLPDTDAEPPGAELFVFEPEEIERIVTDEVGGSALFAARFRECAARALLLPRLNPGRRSPLWQQRQRASQLLEVARKHPGFPIVLETVREVLQDVYDLPALGGLVSKIASRGIRLVEVETPLPSPYARALLFGYVAAFMYEGDSPLAERRAAALSLDPTMLAELLGRAELRELLDPDVIARTELELQRLVPERHARDAEGVVDLLRILGPLSVPEIAARFTPRDAEPERSHPDEVARTIEGMLGTLERDHRVLRASIAGQERFAVIEDASRLRDALGVPLPIGVPAVFVEPVAEPLGDLVSRYARTHGPFTAAEAATRLGLGVAVVADALRRLGADRRVIEGEFRPVSTAAGSISDAVAGGAVPDDTVGPSTGSTEWVDAEVLRRLRARSLAALRQEVEPVAHDALGRFLPAWHHLDAPLRGIDGLVQAIDQLAGMPLPASAWESLVLPTRVRDYSPAWLDELTTSGEVLWSGAGELPGGDGWVALHLADTAPLSLAAAPMGEPDEPTDAQLRILDALASGGAFFARNLAAMNGSGDERELSAALWGLVWAGRVGNDTLAPLRARLGATTTRARAVPHSRAYRGRARYAAASTRASEPPSLAGRWSLLPEAEPDGTVRATAMAERLLDRYGVVTRGAVAAEGIVGGFALAYRVLSGFEDAGRARRGYFVAGLGAAQFAHPATVDRLREFVREPDDRHATVALTLAATDPANPYGSALPWPSRTASGDGNGDAGGATTARRPAVPQGSLIGEQGAEAPAAPDARARPQHRPGRKAGALVVLVDGALVLYVERGGKTVLAFDDEPSILAAAAESLSGAVRRSGGRIRIERVNGEFAVGTGLGDALVTAGFAPTPQGLRLRA